MIRTLSTKTLKTTLRVTLVGFSLLTLSCAAIQRRSQQVEVERASPTDTSSDRTTTQKTTHYTVLYFEEGQAELSASEQQKLRRLASAAKKYGRQVEEIRVLAWADSDDPAEVLDRESQESKMAAERAAEIRKYLKKEIKSSKEIEVYNMATKPGAFNQLVKGDDIEVKTTFENTGNAPLDKGPKSSLGGNKASKAIVLVRYEDRGSL